MDLTRPMMVPRCIIVIVIVGGLMGCLRRGRGGGEGGRELGLAGENEVFWDDEEVKVG